MGTLRRQAAGAARRAMTLIELMVVITVIAILSAMLVPNVGSSIASMELDRTAREIASLMDHCYHNAVATGRVHAMTLDTVTGDFDILAEKAPEPGEDPNLEPALEPVTLPGNTMRRLPEGVTIADSWTFDEELSTTEDGGLRLLFFPDGTAEFARLTIANRYGDRRMIGLSGLSGMITVRRPTAAEAAEALATEQQGGEEAQ